MQGKEKGKRMTIEHMKVTGFQTSGGEDRIMVEGDLRVLHREVDHNGRRFKLRFVDWNHERAVYAAPVITMDPVLKAEVEMFERELTGAR